MTDEELKMVFSAFDADENGKMDTTELSKFIRVRTSS